MQVTLSDEQNAAFKAVMQWFRHGDQVFVLAGYAGAGKTTLARFIANAVGSVHFCAFTGKAANVLREKGCGGATTIHSAIYVKDDDEEGGGEGELENTEPEKPKISEMKFSLNFESDICDKKLVIVDEYSMLPDAIIEDLKKLAVKILFLGDPFQLPPVTGECSLKPNLFLKEVHRQALNSPIIRAATAIRMGERLKYIDDGEFVYKPRKEIKPEIYMRADQLIVGYNKTRAAWNARYRLRLGHEGDYPRKGEKVICLQNNRKSGLFNGMIGTAFEDAELIQWGKLDMFFENDETQWETEAWNGPFHGENTTADKGLKFLDRFDFAYAITCHKSQGSEFDKIVIFDEPIGREKVEIARWRYTAITRGKNQVTLVDSRS